MNILLVTILICSFVFGFASAIDPACGDWEPFKEDYCFKVFDKIGVQTFENAQKTCQDNGSNLMTIQYQEEQTFLTNFIFKKSKVIDNVWIGAKYSESKFKWKDGSELQYTNWANGYPKNHSDYCVLMHSDDDSMGKWVDESCLKKNAVVCQKKQAWSLDKLQKIVLEIKMNPVPLGFIYVQLPKEKAPKDIWPWMIWTDITSEYAGVFFRAEGGEAAAFGQIQEANATVISNVKLIGTSSGGDDGFRDIKPGQWSGTVYSGGNTGKYSFLQFYMTSGENRPRNMAIRVWKRTG